ncbi:potassium channel family protein [Actinoplanes teichomyceticus]|uniref:Ion channel n=1 Tax=Actinoplanes teichomyceticus TaxID=1867 RepID=A0A561WK32_ACTTI|nr:potassium channel family protein [Actinoplanes teichomyceticus]TWG24246.1 ion channel [Actinoplanes teichomyceticus]GIF12908.1 hypothetical protein Ate01nite_29400 [Actinoplanes teichomyceticus]
MSDDGGIDTPGARCAGAGRSDRAEPGASGAPAGPGPGPHAAGAARPPDRYGLLFVLLLGSFSTAMMLDNRSARMVNLLLYATTLLLALRLARFPPRSARWLCWGLPSGSAAVAVLAATRPGRVVEALAALWAAAILLFSVCVIVLRVVRHRVVSVQTILGALSAYLLLGFLFASLFTAAARIDTAPLFTGAQPADSATIQYFAFVTLTTTGYGDLAPAGPSGRSLAVLNALTGQIFLVTLVARLVSAFGTERPPPGPGRTGGG